MKSEEDTIYKIQKIDNSTILVLEIEGSLLSIIDVTLEQQKLEMNDESLIIFDGSYNTLTRSLVLLTNAEDEELEE